MNAKLPHEIQMYNRS